MENCEDKKINIKLIHVLPWCHLGSESNQLYAILCLL